MTDLIFGALAPPLRRQLRAQGLRLTAARAHELQSRADAITILAVAGLLTDAEKDRARQRLLRQIATRASRRR